MTEPITLNIWPGVAPGETDSNTGIVEPRPEYNYSILTHVACPTLSIYRSNNHGETNRPTVLILPGGGYEMLADEHEGTEIAQWLNSFGFDAAILRYRVPKKRDSAFADAQRAIRILRSRGDEFGIDSTKLGVLGFSAGGHLAARLSSRYAYNGYVLIDEIDHIHTRPDFTLLIYPAYLIAENGMPPDDVAPHKVQPPLFLMQSEDDSVYCAHAFNQFAEGAGVKTKCIIYPTGGHGYGLRAPKESPVSNWPSEAEKWLKNTVAAL